MVTDSVTQHRKASPVKLRCAVMTLSTTRTKENDTGGGGIRKGLLEAGHEVVWYEILKDDAPSISGALQELRTRSDLDLIVATGGTGLSALDVTIEAARPLFDKEIPAFAVMFAMLSHEQVGMACLLSRATAGVMNGKVVFCLPGSPKACALALEKIILPEAGHLVKHARERPSQKECTQK